MNEYTKDQLEDINFWAGVEARSNKRPYSSLIYVNGDWDGEKFVPNGDRKTYECPRCGDDNRVEKGLCDSCKKKESE